MRNSEILNAVSLEYELMLNDVTVALADHFGIQAKVDTFRIFRQTLGPWLYRLATVYCINSTSDELEVCGDEDFILKFTRKNSSDSISQVLESTIFQECIRNVCLKDMDWSYQGEDIFNPDDKFNYKKNSIHKFPVQRTSLSHEKKYSNVVVFGMDCMFLHKLFYCIKGHDYSDAFEVLYSDYQTSLNKYSVDLSLRKRLAQVLKDAGASDLALISVLVMPISLLEAFYLSVSVLYENLYHKTVFVTKKAHLTNDFFNIVCSFSRELFGSELHVFQHGGGDMHELGVYQSHQMKISDRFYVWGKNRLSCSANNIHSYPCHMLKIELFYRLGLYSKNKIFYGDVVVVVRTLENNPTLIEQGHLFDDYDEYIEELYSIYLYTAANVTFRIKSSTCPEYNMLVGRGGVEVKRRLNFASGWREYITMLKTCKIVVVSYVATTYIETMLLNKPTLIYYDINSFQLDSSLSCIVAELLNAKIIFTNMNLLIGHLNFVVDDVDSWWLSSEVQAARRSLLEVILPRRSVVTSLYSIYN